MSSKPLRSFGGALKDFCEKYGKVSAGMRKKWDLPGGDNLIFENNYYFLWQLVCQAEKSWQM